MTTLLRSNSFDNSSTKVPSESKSSSSSSIRPTGLFKRVVSLRRCNTMETQVSVTSIGSSVTIDSQNRGDIADNAAAANLNDVNLEELAESLKKELVDKKLVREQQSSLFTKTIPKAFSGKDAVDILQKLLREEEFNAVAISREQAVQKGNQMMERFNFFKHATCGADNKPLQDTPTDFYQFDYNLPTEVRRTKNRYKTPWDKVRLLEDHIECKDRKHMFRVFPNCFVAQEAVDVMMDLKLVKSRKEAVHLMKHVLNKKVFCCEHVTQEHEFQDSYLFFEFIPHNERMPEPKRVPRSGRSSSPAGGTKKNKDSSRSRSRSRKRKEKEAATSNSNSGGEDANSVKSCCKSEEDQKKVNQRRAEGIKNRLANYKQEQQMTRMMKQKNNQDHDDEESRKTTLSTVAA